MSEPGVPEEPIETPTPDSKSDPYGVLRNRDFVLYLSGRFIASFTQQMLSVAVGWEIYDRTGKTLYLGYVGLVQVVPMFLLTLHAGHVADNYSRKHVILWMQLLIGTACTALACFSLLPPETFSGQAWQFIPQIFHVPPYVFCVLACLAVFGAARTYLWAASASFMPQLVERHQFAKAVTVNSGSFQISAVVGPAAGGAMVALHNSAGLVYVLNVGGSLLCALLIGLVKSHHKAAVKEPMSLKNVAAGLKFVYRTKIILGSITLDMFAVLLGGATALLPVYAKDILHTGPKGLGWLQAALPLGSLLMSGILLHRPPLQKAGASLLWAVVGFGLATIGFGLSKVFWLSFLMLFLCGVTDYISVVVRHTLVQLLTPDEMRGRVSAVNSLFIGTSNQMGDFESGFVAYYTSPLFAVVSGGIGTIVVVAIVAFIWPEIRKYGRLDA
jgi:MFS family permease